MCAALHPFALPSGKAAFDLACVAGLVREIDVEYATLWIHLDGALQRAAIEYDYRTDEERALFEQDWKAVYNAFVNKPK